jgi:hypothetical protein
MATVVVNIYDTRVKIMTGWNGEVGRAVDRLAGRMVFGQKRLAPSKTGALRLSIRQGRKGRWARGIETSVGANPRNGVGRIGVAMWQNEGTFPHQILPKPGNRRGHMTFFWVKMGRMAYPTRVWHPGNPAVHWAEEGALYGMMTWT